MKSPIKKIAHKLNGLLETREEQVQHITHQAKANPNHRNKATKRLAALMMLPVALHIRDREEFLPQSLTLTWSQDTTTIKVEQLNQTETFEYGTPEIHDMMDELTPQK